MKIADRIKAIENHEELTLKELSGILNLSNQSLRQAIMNSGLKYKLLSKSKPNRMKGKSVPGSIYDKITKLGDVSGMTVREISNALGKDPSSIYNILSKHNIVYKRTTERFFKNSTYTKILELGDISSFTVPQISEMIGRSVANIYACNGDHDLKFKKCYTGHLKDDGEKIFEVGKHFGNFEVKEVKGRKVVVKCICGNEREYFKFDMTKRNVTHCGCMKR
jgi:predicted transcriptional regulator